MNIKKNPVTNCENASSTGEDCKLKNTIVNIGNCVQGKWYVIRLYGYENRSDLFHIHKSINKAENGENEEVERRQHF